MGNLFEYVDWRGDISFSELGVCEVDNLIFSQICYVDFKRMVPSSLTARPVGLLTAARRYMNAHKEKGDAANLGMIMPPEIISMLIKAARSRRFGEAQLVGYINRISDDEQMQFSALTFLLGDDALFVAFRGTDDTLVGWKESFNMSFLSPVPAQTEAEQYVARAAEAFPNRKIYLGGHSKGGNLAVWAAVKVPKEVNERIVTVYNNDGPGFNTEFISSEEYAYTRDRIKTLVPQTSIVGMMLEHEENYEVVESSYSGLLQHNSFSWRVMGGHFIHLDTVTEESKKIDSTLKEWLYEMTNDERREFFDTLYEILSSTHAKTLSELNADKLALIKVWNTLDAHSKKVVKRFIAILVKTSKAKKAKPQRPQREEAQTADKSTEEVIGEVIAAQAEPTE